MKNKTNILVMILLLFTLSSCYNFQKLRLLQDNNRTLPVYNKSDYKDYKIQINDELIYRLITSDETISKIIASPSSTTGQNQISYRVYTDGTIDLPFISHISVVDR